MGKKVPKKLLTLDTEGRSHYDDILVDEETGEDVQPDDVKLSASEKSSEKSSQRDRR